ncbi:MAG: uracil-DNA glycosylase [Bdellovibrionales bacterium]|nr:uracil-DNA glycosylase [Bdellovibrionales bacterium]
MSSVNTVSDEQIKVDPEWKAPLLDEFSKSYMAELRVFLKREAQTGKVIFPRGSEIFNALNLTPLSKVKVVILGQDPYHGAGQAHGLCFSVRDGVPFPPSLRNIFQELHADLGVPIPPSGNLTKWARQGVLLLNAVLTVEESKAASHKGKGWEIFTDRVIQVLSEREDPVVFLLWGAFAQSKAKLIRTPPHLILKTVHPSPLSAHNGFFGCRHFSKTNEILRSWGREPIDWDLTRP